MAHTTTWTARGNAFWGVIDKKFVQKDILLFENLSGSFAWNVELMEKAEQLLNCNGYAKNVGDRIHKIRVKESNAIRRFRPRTIHIASENVIPRLSTIDKALIMTKRLKTDGKFHWNTKKPWPLNRMMTSFPVSQDSTFRHQAYRRSKYCM